MKRVASAVGEGSIAVAFVHRVLKESRSTMPAGACEHINAVDNRPAARSAHECEECVTMGAPGCTCGPARNAARTRCCDNSPNRHATGHARRSGHPVIASAEPGERWLYCYPDDAFAEDAGRRARRVVASEIATRAAANRPRLPPRRLSPGVPTPKAASANFAKRIAAAIQSRLNAARQPARSDRPDRVRPRPGRRSRAPSPGSIATTIRRSIALRAA